MKTFSLILLYSKNIIVFFLITCFASCNENKKSIFDEKVIEKIALENTEYPSAFSSTPFFGKCSSNQVCLVYVQDLRAIHALKYKQIDFLEFLKKSLNQEITIDYQDKIECFDLDKNVTLFYQGNDFNSFLNLYTKKTKSNRLALKKGIKSDQLETVIYYLFLNNYLTSYDDHLGKYYVDKTSLFYKKTD
jgi:hypothetical protein